MKTRRSKRLSKSPVIIENNSNKPMNNGKKQKLAVKTYQEDSEESEDEIKSMHTSGRGSSDSNNFCNNSSHKTNGNESDSSNSSVDYMKSPQTLDLNSDFFKVDLKKKPGPSSDFSAIENKIFAGIHRLSDTDGSSSDNDSNKAPYFEIPIPKTFQTMETPATTEKSSETEVKTKKKFIPLKSKKKDSSNLHTTTSLKKVKNENNVNEMDVSQLLAIGESQKSKNVNIKKHITISEDEMSDWEEVKVEVSKDIKQENCSIPKEGVQITLDAPDIYQRRKQKDFDMEAFLKRRVNRIKREQQVFVHKVHLLCWIAHGLHVNSVLNSEMLMGLSLSLIPSQHSYPNKVDIIYLKKLVGWFLKSVPVVENAMEKGSFVPLVESLQHQLEKGTACSNRDLVLMFVCLLRSLGLTARLIISLQPVRLKPSSHELCTVKDKKNKEEKNSQENKKVKKEVVVKEEKESKKKSKEHRRVLSPEEARKSNAKAKQKEEAIKLVKSSVSDTKTKPSKAKRLKVTSLNTEQSRAAEENPRRSFRAKKQGVVKYKDVSSTSEDECVNETQKLTSSENNYSFTSNPKMKVGTSSLVTQRNTSEKDSEMQRKSCGKLNSKDKRNTVEHKEPNKITSKSLEMSESKIHALPNIGKKASVSEKLTNKSTQSQKVSEEDKHKSRQVRKRGREAPNKKAVDDSGSSKNKDKTPEKRKENVKHTKATPSNPTNHKLSTSGDEFVPQSQKILSQKGSSDRKSGKKKHSSRKSDTDTDFEHEVTKKITQSKRNSKNGSETDRRVLSSDSEDSGENETKTKNDFWAEVLVDSQEWIPVNVVTGEVNGIENLRKLATKPVTYIVAWNPDLTIKDVTCRYCKQFHSVTRKQRVDEKWWKESLFPFLSSNTARDKKEDDDMQKQMQDQPLPTSIAEYKNHPLYVLKRHLLKFQAIYPPSAPTLGFVKGEPVYPRDCVYTLHSREIWLKEAKVVRLGEQPYKVVKARPKYDRMSGKVITDLPLEIFGMWQVEDYVPPTAVDGKVPRNAYGNVELFKPSMLPKGTVHLQVPSLNRVAKKLQIDCAPAVVGFDYHCGACHPMYDGFVVCEEFQDVLLDAWNRDQEEAERREIEKREKRVYGNWRRLIKGLLIRERLKIKYAFGEEEERGDGKPSSSKGKKGKKGKQGKAAQRKTRSDDEDSE